MTNLHVNRPVKFLYLRNENWTQPYPPMKIARHSSTAVSFNNHIIVAGGRDDKVVYLLCGDTRCDIKKMVHC